MAKMKTHSASKKRFRKTASGKIKRSKAFRRHHAWAKSSKRISHLRGVHHISAADAPGIARLLAAS